MKSILCACTALLASAPAPAATFDLATASIADINAAFDAGALTSEKLIELYLNRIKAYDEAGPKIHAIVTLNEQALAQARALDAERREKGPRSPMHGIPVVLKDLIDAAGLPTSCGFEPFGLPVPPRHATVVQRLVDGGAIVLAKVTTVNWFGAGYNETFYKHPTKNPYNLAYDCGATSAGSGGAIAANFATVALGTDTSQSVQNPAARTSTVGMVGSFGMVSRAGVMPRSPYHDRVGPITRSVADAAVVFSLISGWDAEDFTTNDGLGHHPVEDWSRHLGARSLKGVRLGVLREMFWDHPAHKEGQELFDRAIADLKKAGAFIVDPVMTGQDLKTISGGGFMRLAEFEKFDHSNTYLARYGDAIPFKTMQELMERVGPDKFSRGMVTALELPRPGTAEEYDARFRACLALRAQLNDIMRRYKLDGFVQPFEAVGASLLEPVPGAERVPGSGNSLGSYAGLPAVVVPGGYKPSDNRPIGIQFIGPTFGDLAILQIAHGYEQASLRRIQPSTTPSLPGEVFEYTSPSNNLSSSGSIP